MGSEKDAGRRCTWIEHIVDVLYLDVDPCSPYAKPSRCDCAIPSTNHASALILEYPMETGTGMGITPRGRTHGLSRREASVGTGVTPETNMFDRQDT